VTLTVRPTNRPPELTSVPVVQAVCNEPYTYDVDAIDPDGHKLRYERGSATNVPGTLTVNPDTGLVSWTPTSLGLYTIQVNIYDELGLGIAHSYYVDVTATAPNHPPKIESNPPLVAEVGQVWSYAIVATDPDAGQTPTVTLHVPEQLLANMTFADEVITWTPAAALENTLVAFEVWASDGAYTSKQWFKVAVQPANSAPVITPIPDETVTAGAAFRLDVVATDLNSDSLSYDLDAASKALGLSIDENGRITWQPDEDDIEDSPYTVTVSVTDGRADPVTDQFLLTVAEDTEVPQVTIQIELEGGRTDADLGQEVKILVHAKDNVGVKSRTLTLYSVTLGGNTTVLNRELALDGSGRARLTLTSELLGTLEFHATAKDVTGLPKAAEPETLEVLDPTDLSAPTVSLFSPVARQKISQPVDVLGSVYDGEADVHWTLEAVPLDGNGSVPVASGYGNMDHALLGRFDPTNVRNGSYDLVLTATDLGGHSAAARVTVEVEGLLKLGNFTLSFIDLQLPLVGLPITITRTYDTLDATVQGDFGYGWSLDLSNTKVAIDHGDGQTSSPYQPFQEGSRVLVTLPDGTKEGFRFYPTPVWQDILVSEYLYPKFVAELGVKSELLVANAPLLFKTTTNTYQDMTTGYLYTPADALNFVLRLRNGNELAIDAETGDLVSITDLSGNTLIFSDMGIEHSSGRGVQFERENGRITAVIDPAGRRITYDYDSAGNLIAVTDRADATTTFTYLTDPAHYLDKVLDPYGREAARTEFDADGRIKRVVDADGKVIEYSFDPEGKVQRITNQLGHTTVLVTDARGNVVREEDPEGGIKLRSYDAEDHLLSETIVVGQIDSPENGENDDLTTTSTYDDAGNLMTQTDPRGNVTRYSYNDYGQVTSVAGPGVSTSNTYDEYGLLRHTYDTTGQSTRFDYDGRGNLTTVKNGDGVLLFSRTYNRYGEVLTSTPAAGHTTSFDYDQNGNQAAQWYFDGEGASRVQVLDVTHYDDAGRVEDTARVVLPDGHFVTQNLATATFDPQYVRYSTSTTYDFNGQVLSQTDQSGRVTQYTYDARGQQVQTRSQSSDETGAPVWLITRSVYDAAGRAVVATDQYVEGMSEPIAGTRTTYDKAGRVVRTERLRGLDVGLYNNETFVRTIGTIVSTTTTTYDNAGRVTLATDQLGAETETLYNAFGETVQTRTESLDAAGQPVWLVSRMVYDPEGRVELSTDQYVGATSDYATRTLYDGKGRVMATLGLEGADVDVVNGNTVVTDYGTELWRTETVYDAKGRTQRTIGRYDAGDPDAARPATDHEYDALGRQAAMIGPAVTDEVTDDLVRHRSETKYDAQGRVQETRDNIRVVVDANGSVLGTSYANKHVTAFEYDQLGRKTKTIYGVGTAIESYVAQGYDDLGRVIWETEQALTTNQNPLRKDYGYDAAGRLVAVVLPEVAHPTLLDGSDPLMVRPRYEYTYDAQGNQVTIRDNVYQIGSDPATAEVFYDHGGTAGDFTEDYDTRVTEFAYDAQGRQVSRTLPIGTSTPGDPDDFTERKSYSDRSLGEAEAAGEDLGASAALGQLAYEVSFEGVVTACRYDNSVGGGGRLAAKYYYGGATAVADYLADAADGTLTQADDATTYTYDAQGRTVQVVQDTDQRVVTNGFDAYGRPTSVAMPEGTIHYEYDPVTGERVRTWTGTNSADPDTDTRYDYDPLGRLDAVRAVARNGEAIAPEVTDYVYDLLGNLDQVWLANGVVSDYDYDSLNRLELLRQFRDDGDHVYEASVDTVLAEFDYDLLADGRRSGVTERDDQGRSTRIDWLYDNAGRLTAEVYDSDNDDLDFITRYKFDLVGNRLEKASDTDPASGDFAAFLSDGTLTPDETVTYTYDANDRLLTEAKDVAGGTANDRLTEYKYGDSNEKTQQTKKTVKLYTDGSGGTLEETAYAYNLQGRMSQALVDEDGDSVDEKKVEYEYGDDGIRASQTVTEDTNHNGSFADETPVETKYLNDKQNPTGYSQVLEELSGAAVLLKSYTLGLDVISQPTSASAVHFLLYDGHGSTRALVDASGDIITSPTRQVFAYDAYGNAIGFNLANALTTLLYSGEWLDKLTNLQYLRARYYNPLTASFTTLDSFAGNPSDPQSLHKYVYCHADPVNHVDPTGQFFSLLVTSFFSFHIRGLSTGVSLGILGAFTAGVGFAWWSRSTNYGDWFAGRWTSPNNSAFWVDAFSRGPKAIADYKANHLNMIQSAYPNAGLSSVLDTYSTIYSKVVSRRCDIALEYLVAEWKQAISDDQGISNGITFIPAALEQPPGQEGDNILILVPKSLTWHHGDFANPAWYMTGDTNTKQKIIFFYVGSDPLVPIGNLYEAVSNKDGSPWGQEVRGLSMEEGF